MSVAAKWQQFFLEAGIPRKIAVQYSHLFVEQRISETMLEEIDKSTLVDLGITTIGDQIAILRHIRAKALNRGDSKSSQRMIDTDGKRKESNMPTPDVESSKPTRTRLAPDRDDIYHVRLPAGTTPRTRAIMAKHNLMKSAEVSSTTSNVYERLGVQGLVSDAMRQAVPIRSLSTSTPSRNQHFTKATSLVHRALDEAIAPRANQPLFRVRISDEQGPRTSRFHRGAISRIAGGQIRRDLRTLKMAPGGSVRKRSVVATRPSTAVYTQFRGKRIGIKPQVSVFERLG
uniref:SAM domain-containing protein n=1 Tax=Parascaris univalens TaxID=6257 RepID=A0A915ADN4_PARUN